MKLLDTLQRRKRLVETEMGETKLARVLTTFDLTSLGVGSTLGVGIYVIAGEVSKHTAGPAVIISFLLAAIASLFAGLCYAEFGARIPKAGSVYVYCYYCVGEFCAFIMGWTLILEYVIGTASVARGLSQYIDSLANNTIQHAFTDAAPINAAGFLAPYFDFLAFSFILLLSLALAFGVRESAIVNNFFTCLNVCVVIFVIVAGAVKADVNNWKLAAPPPDVDGGSGGFFPFGVIGALKGAAVCFYGFVGFDCIATTGEEVKNPQKAIPFSILLSLFIVFLAYSGISSVLTLMLPYYLQDPDAPIPFAFEYVGWEAAKWVVTIGGVFGLCASLFGAMFPLPRIVYAMANDGLLFKFLGVVDKKFQTPLFGTLTVGVVTSLLAAILDLQQLVYLTSMGTLLAYTMVAVCVIILRYRKEEDDYMSDASTISYEESTNLVNLKTKLSVSKILGQFVNTKQKCPTPLTSAVTVVQIIIYCILSICISLTFLYAGDSLANGEALGVSLTCLFGLLMILFIILISLQPTATKDLAFKMPWVPALPCLSIFINIYLMILLDGSTWIRFAIWMAIGIIPFTLWYLWRWIRHRTFGAQSKYEINRINFIRLTENTKKVLRKKQETFRLMRNSFYENGIFILEEETPKNSIITISATDATIMHSKTSSLNDEDSGLQMAIDLDESSHNSEMEGIVDANYGFLGEETDTSTLEKQKSEVTVISDDYNNNIEIDEEKKQLSSFELAILNKAKELKQTKVIKEIEQEEKLDDKKEDDQPTDINDFKTKLSMLLVGKVEEKKQTNETKKEITESVDGAEKESLAKRKNEIILSVRNMDELKQPTNELQKPKTFTPIYNKNNSKNVESKIEDNSEKFASVRDRIKSLEKQNFFLTMPRSSVPVIQSVKEEVDVAARPKTFTPLPPELLKQIQKPEIRPKTMSNKQQPISEVRSSLGSKPPLPQKPVGSNLDHNLRPSSTKLDTKIKKIPEKQLNTNLDGDTVVARQKMLMGNVLQTIKLKSKERGSIDTSEQVT